MIRLMRSLGTVLVLAALAQGMIACATGKAAGSLPPVDAAVTSLPPPAHSSDVSLERALGDRRSVRDYGDQPLTTADLGQLLWAAQGITHERGFRTAPSAGALYPLEVYLATAEGVFHYDPGHHQLILVKQGDARPALYQAALSQEPVVRAPAVSALAAV